MCRNARIPTRQSLETYLGDLVDTIPEYQPCENANSYDHPEVPIMYEWKKMGTALWGLVPEWVKPGDFERAKKMMDSNRNAVSETIFERSSYKESIRERRCIMFIIGIHEWRHEGKKKIPYYVTMGNDDPIPCAGVWTHWRDQTGEIVKTCSMITTPANPLMADVHNSKQRMPLILPKEDFEGWLTPGLPDSGIETYFKVFPDTDMKAERKEEEPKPPKQRPGSDEPTLFDDPSQW